jgi:trehalose 2-sulfotransferase
MLREQWGLPVSVDIGTYVNVALRRATSSNGVTGMKIQWMHVAGLAHELGCPERDVLPTLLPDAQFINIVRRDLMAQALSWYRAIATDVWWRLDDEPTPPPPPLDAGEVLALKSHLEMQQQDWQRYFAERGIVPLTIAYECLDGDYHGQVARALRFLGLDDSAAEYIPAPRLSRQADEVTASWRLELASLVGQVG